MCRTNRLLKQGKRLIKAEQVEIHLWKTNLPRADHSSLGRVLVAFDSLSSDDRGDVSVLDSRSC